MPCADADCAGQQQPGSTSKRKRASERTAHSQDAQHAQQAQHAQHAQHAQQAQRSIGAQLPAEIPYRPMKRIKRGLRTLNKQQPEVSDATLVPQTRELRAMTSVRGSRHTLRPRSERECAAWGEPAEARITGADQQATIVMETAIQQLQSELMVGQNMCISLVSCILLVHVPCLYLATPDRPHVFVHVLAGDAVTCSQHVKNSGRLFLT